MTNLPHRFLPMVGYVALASLLGLASAMAITPVLLFSVWGASVLGDLVFAVGMSATGWGAWRLARSRAAAGSLGLGFAGGWLTYALSWAISGSAMGDESFDGDPFSFTLRWGWPGLVFSAIAPWLFARQGARSEPIRTREPTADL